MKFKIPKGYSISIGHYDQKPLSSDYIKLTRKNFKMNRQQVNKIQNLIRRMRFDAYIISVQNSAGKTVAVSCVLITGKFGWLFGGNVLSSYRNKGLWTALLGARQQFSAAHGVKTWMLITSVPQIMKKRDVSVKWTIYSKSFTKN